MDESSSRFSLLFEHDLRANARRLSRGNTAAHFALTRPFRSGSCSSVPTHSPRSEAHVAAGGSVGFLTAPDRYSVLRGDGPQRTAGERGRVCSIKPTISRFPPKTGWCNSRPP